MDEIIDELRKTGLSSFLGEGRSKSVFNPEFLYIFATTESIETDLDWWELRLFLVRN